MTHAELDRFHEADNYQDLFMTWPVVPPLSHTDCRFRCSIS